MLFKKLCFKKLLIWFRRELESTTPRCFFFFSTDSLSFHSRANETRLTYQFNSLEPIQVFATGLETNKRDLLNGFTKQGSHKLQKSW